MIYERGWSIERILGWAVGGYACVMALTALYLFC